MQTNLTKIIKISAITLVSLTTFFSSFKIIKTSEVGVVVRMGVVQDKMMSTGFNFKLPFIDNVIVKSLKQQQDNSTITPQTKDFQEVAIEYQVIYSIPEKYIIDNIKNINGNVFDVMIKKRTDESFRNVVSHYDATFLAQNRSIIISEILKEANKKLNGIAVIDNILLLKHKFNASFQQQVNEKMKMTQQAETAKIKKEKAQYEADAVVITAQGLADSIRIKSEALAKSSDPRFIEFEKIQKWNGVSPTTVTLVTSNKDSNFVSVIK